MIFVKSALVGLLALVLALALLPMIVMFVLMVYGWINPQSGGGAIGWDPVSLIKQSPALPVASILIVFALGFVWEFRRSCNDNCLLGSECPPQVLVRSSFSSRKQTRNPAIEAR